MRCDTSPTPGIHPRHTSRCFGARQLQSHAQVSSRTTQRQRMFSNCDWPRTGLVQQYKRSAKAGHAPTMQQAQILLPQRISRMPSSIKRFKSKKDPPLTFSVYTTRIHKQVNGAAKLNMTDEARRAVSLIAAHLNRRICAESGQFAKDACTKTISSRHAVAATQLVLSGELAKHAVAEAAGALQKYTASYQ